MIRAPLTMEMAPDSALSVVTWCFPPAQFAELIALRDAFPLQRRFACDPFVRGVVRGEIGNLSTTMLAIDARRRGSCAVALLLGECALLPVLFSPFFEELFAEHYRRDLSSFGAE